MATLRVSEKEAIKRGWMEAPPPQTEPVVEIKYINRRGYSLALVMCCIGGWLLGFFMATMFR